MHYGAHARKVSRGFRGVVRTLRGTSKISIAAKGFLLCQRDFYCGKGIFIVTTVFQLFCEEIHFFRANDKIFNYL